MTLLTMTAAIVAAVHTYQNFSENNKGLGEINMDEPSLSNPRIGNPITHEQLIALHNVLKPYKSICNVNVHLDQLLRGSYLYKVPKTTETINRTKEYESFMAALRRNEETRKYQQMLQFTPEKDTNTRQSPEYSGLYMGSSPKNNSQNMENEDEITFADLSRQVALIINVFVSVIACSFAIWVVSRWWDTPTRLFLSISAGVLVSIAEVIVYGGYLRRLTEAKEREKRITEKKEILDTWILQGDDRQGNAANIVIKDRSGSTKRRNSKRHGILDPTNGTSLSENQSRLGPD